jgi:uncharacterized protein
LSFFEKYLDFGISEAIFEILAMKTAANNSDLLKIRISRLSDGTHEYHFTSNPGEIGLEDNFKNSVTVDVRLDKASRQMYLRSDIRTSGSFQCDRCLEVFDQELSTHFNMMYVYDELDTKQFPADEVHVLSPDTVSIDIAEDVRQMVELSVPLKLLCREDCKGLCPRCGTNWNHESCTCAEEKGDSRWTKLKDVINN